MGCGPVSYRYDEMTLKGLSRRAEKEPSRKESRLTRMAWARPQYTKRKVNDAGKVIASGVDTGNLDELVQYWKALDVVNNWRSSHNFPLNTFHVGLKRRAKIVDPGCITAQRIKRLTSIEHKLRRFSTMTLSQMQDIGGCRAILSSAARVQAICKNYFYSDIKHELAQRDDYIAEPKDSGYRGVHLIYKYFSDKKTDYNTLKIEIQLRSQLQHAWATAVETVGTLQQQALKSSQGEEDWLRFFALASSAFALREGVAPVPNTPKSYKLLIEELRDHARRLDLAKRLRAYGQAMRFLANPQHGRSDNHYFLLEMNPASMSVEVTAFKMSESEAANAKYLEIEKKLKNSAGAEAVLVSVDSLDAVRKAYPNYFLDTHVFLRLIAEATRTIRPPRAANPKQRQLRLF